MGKGLADQYPIKWIFRIHRQMDELNYGQFIYGY